MVNANQSAVWYWNSQKKSLNIIEPPSVFLTRAINWWDITKMEWWRSTLSDDYAPILSLFMHLFLPFYPTFLSQCLSLFSNLLFPSSFLYEVKAKREIKCSAGVLWWTDSQIMDYPITETSSIVLCVWMTGVMVDHGEKEWEK